MKDKLVTLSTDAIHTIVKKTLIDFAEFFVSLSTSECDDLEWLLQEYIELMQSEEGDESLIDTEIVNQQLIQAGKKEC